MKTILSTVCVAASLAFSTSAFAGASGVAEILSTSGKVMVQQGDGFVPVSGPVALKAGDQIMIGKDASAEVFFAKSDCSITIAEGTVYRVGAKAPCSKGDTVAFADNLIVQPVDGGAPPAVPAIVAGVVVIAAGTVVFFGDDAVSGN